MPARALVTLVLVLAAASARGAELLPGWTAEGTWDSNVFRTDTNEQKAFSVQSGPDIRFRETQGDLTYDVNLQPRYEYFPTISDASEFEYFLAGEGRWQITPRTWVELAEDFDRTSSLGELIATDPVQDIGIITVRRDRITSNLARATFTHNLSRLWQLSAQFDNRIVGYENPNQSDSSSTSGSLQVTRGISRRLVAGAGAVAQRQVFQNITDGPDRGTTFFQGFALVTYDITPTWHLSASGGPAWAIPDQIDRNSYRTSAQISLDPTTCPERDGTPFVPQSQLLTFESFDQGPCARTAFRDTESGEVIAFPPALAVGSTEVPFVGSSTVDPTLTYFGRLSVEKTWSLWRASFSYSRSANTASSIGTSTTLDVLQGTLEYTPSQSWLWRLTATYSRQEAASTFKDVDISVTPGVMGTDYCLLGGVPQDIPDPICTLLGGQVRQAEATFSLPIQAADGDDLNNAYDVRTYRFEFRGRKQVSKHLSITGTASYYRQEQEGDLLRGVSRDDFRVTLGFSWHFDPIQL